MRTRHAVCGFLRPVPRPCQPHARPCTRHDVLPRAPPRHTPCGSAASPDALPHAPPRRTARAAPPQPPLCGVCVRAREVCVLRGGVRAREVCVPGRCACEEGWVCWRGLRVLAGLGVCWCAAAGTRPGTATTTMATTTTATTEATCLCRSAASLPNERTDRADLPQAGSNHR